MNPRAEIGLNDDWSYVYSAKRLAETGHVIYNGWASPLLGWQLYLGALFIHLFGFSFTVVRASTILIAALTAPLLQTIFLRLGVRPWNATFGTLTFVLSPVFLPLAAGYMSDIPSIFCILLCLYCCLCAVQATDDGDAMRWLLLAAVTNVAGGTVRQITWLGALVMVPGTAWLLRRRRGMLVAAIVLWSVSAVSIFLLMRWFQHQPYAAVEKLFPLALTRVNVMLRMKILVKRVSPTAAVLLLPILAGFAWRVPACTARQKRAILAFVCLLAGGILIPTATHPSIRWMTFLLGDYLTPKGILEIPRLLLGDTPDSIPTWAQAVATLAVLAITAVALYALVLLRRTGPFFADPRVTVTLFWLLGPFTAAYLVLIVTREAIFDRYLLPLVAIALMLLLIAYETRVGRRLPLSCFIVLAVGACYGIAGSHDMFAFARARLQAADTLRARGIPKTAIRAGFEYDGWTEIEQRGFVNEPRIHVPAGAYRPVLPPQGLPEECNFWFRSYTPAIHARYELSNQQGLCFPDAGIPPVLYHTWLPPHNRSIYFVAVPDAVQ